MAWCRFHSQGIEVSRWKLKSDGFCLRVHSDNLAVSFLSGQKKRNCDASRFAQCPIFILPGDVKEVDGVDGSVWKKLFFSPHTRGDFVSCLRGTRK